MRCGGVYGETLDALSASTKYWWRVRGENDLGEGPWSRANWFETSTETAAEQPLELELEQLHLEVFPNPAPSEVQIKLRLVASGPVRIEAFDALGRKLEVIFEGVLATGMHVVEWKTAPQPPGLLFLRAEAAGRSIVRSVMIP